MVEQGCRSEAEAELNDGAGKKQERERLRTENPTKEGKI
jgi:hypothetical protein